MKNLFRFQAPLSGASALLVGLFFLFSLTTWGSGACWGQLALSGGGDWTADIAISFSPEQAGRGPEIERKLQAILQREVQSQRVAHRLTQRQERNAELTYTISLQGNEGLDQFKRVVFFAADPTIPLSDGPVALALTGRVKKGESVPITLESNPSTGYSWEFINAAPLPTHQPREALFQAKGNLLGAPVTQTLFLEGLEEGETSLEFIYRRPWEKEERPGRRTTIQVPELAMVADLSNPNPPLLRTAETVSASPEGEVPSLSAPLPAAFDWRSQNGHNYVSPVKNQGGCGSCWAFGTVAPMEAQLLISGAGLTDLSEQYLVSCNSNGWSCGGGWWAHDYHINSKIPAELQSGSVLESVFPYTGSNSACNAPHAHSQKLVRWNYVGSSYGVPSVDAIKNAIVTYGPVAVAVCVGPGFQGYRSGIFATDEKSACNGYVNHAVVLVGWDDASDTWIMKNSWGTGWGESGYMRIKRGVSNIGYAANYVVYATSPPPPPPPPPPQFTPTHWVYLPLLISSYGINNGNFENGPDGTWTISSTFYQGEDWYIILNLSDYQIPYTNHSGNYAAWLGGDPSEITTLSQRFLVPTDATRLEYWYWIGSNDSCGYSFATVTLDGNPLRLPYDLCQVTSDWAQELIDIPPYYQGRMVTLTFEARIAPDPSGTFYSDFLLDDISILGPSSASTLKSAIQAPKSRRPFPPGVKKSILRSAEKNQ